MTERRTGRLYLEFPGPELVQVVEGGTIVSKGYLDTAGRSEEWHKRLRRLLESDATGESATHTTADVAALVEEIKAKTYDGVKARVLSLLEALLQAKGLGTEPAGRVLDILLRDVDRLILDTATKHVPEITSDLLDEQRTERERAEADTDTSLKRLYDRERQLKLELERVQDLAKDRERERAIMRLNYATVKFLGTERIEEAISVLLRSEQPAEPGPFVAAIRRGERAFERLDAKKGKPNS